MKRLMKWMGKAKENVQAKEAAAGSASGAAASPASGNAKQEEAQDAHHRLFMLGTSESGRATLFKQLKQYCLLCTDSTPPPLCPSPSLVCCGFGVKLVLRRHSGH
jgi:hypothetical protein